MPPRDARRHATRVCILGSGPAGLLLSVRLSQAGVDNILVDRAEEIHILSRIRAGILETATVDLLLAAGAGGVASAGAAHARVAFSFDGEPGSVDLAGLTNGCTVTAYGQTELTRELMALRTADAFYGAEEVALHGCFAADGSHDSTLSPSVTFVHGGVAHNVECAFVAGCDGFHGASRAAVPRRAITEFHRAFPFGWLGVLVDTPPASPDAVLYAASERGFACCSMRSPTRSRYYIQVPLSDSVSDWDDDSFFNELKRRLDPVTASRVVPGATIEKSIAPLRSFVAEPMRFGSLFLCGDAAHIVPPTGAKGLNLAAADAALLSDAFASFFATGSPRLLDGYSPAALAHVWRAERFTWWLTELLHTFPPTGGGGNGGGDYDAPLATDAAPSLPDSSAFAQRLRKVERALLVTSRAEATVFAENYTGQFGRVGPEEARAPAEEAICEP